MIDEPVQNACGSLRKSNSLVDQRIHSSAQVLRCSAISASAKANSSDEVAIARHVEAVGRHALEAQPPGHVVAVDRQARAGHGRGAQAAARWPGARQSASRPPVALEFFAVGQPVVGGQHRLGPLQVRVAGQDARRRRARQRPTNARCKLDQPRVDLVDRVADPEPQIGRDLVVAAAGGVQLAADVAEAVDQRPLDVHVDVFQFGAEREAALLNFLADLAQRLLNLLAFVGGDAGRPWPASGHGRSSRRCPAHKGGGRSSRFR